MDKETTTIHLATDHAGFELKEMLKIFLQGEGWKVVDHGAAAYNDGDDYPEFIARAARVVSGDPTSSVGVVIGGSGTGEAIVANRFPRVRCALYNGGPCETVALSREHNNANCLSLGARFLDESLAREVVSLWLDTPFSKESRHENRIEQIEEISK